MRLGRAAPDRAERRGSWKYGATIGLLGVIALLLAMNEGLLAVVVIASVIGLVGAFHFFLHARRAFALALANLIGIYACVFLFFVETNFDAVGTGVLSLGFVMPLVAFLLGSLRKQREIHRIVLSREIGTEHGVLGFLMWLLPILAVGALTFLLPSGPGAVVWQESGLLVSMLGISAIVFVVSRDIAIFLHDTGILFEAFFARITRLVVPAFAFLTFYSMLVILFASFYSIADHISDHANFRVNGVLRSLSFPESLYYSLTTLSTVGYGDIAPVSSVVRLLSAVEIVCGILLLLFGFNEIFSFAQEQARQRRGDRGDKDAD